jgi:hypothetical protein
LRSIRQEISLSSEKSPYKKRQKYPQILEKNVPGQKTKAAKLLLKVSERQPQLFAHRKIGIAGVFT